MPYILDISLPIRTNIKRIIRELDDKIIDEIKYSEKPKHEIVHYIRKRSKEIRGIIRLIRPRYEHIYKKENIWYRDAARILSFVRDSQSVIEAIDRLMENYKDHINRPSFDFIYQFLIHRRETVVTDQKRLDQLLNLFSEKIKTARGRINFWPIKDDGFVAINKGLQKTYGRGKNALLRAYKKPTTEYFHEWRKRVKYHWFHLRLITPVWPDFIDNYVAEVEQLAEYLGDEHDLAILEEIITKTEWKKDKQPKINELLYFIGKRRSEIRNISHPLGLKLFFDKPENMAKRFAYYWSVKQRELVST